MRVAAEKHDVFDSPLRDYREEVLQLILTPVPAVGSRRALTVVEERHDHTRRDD